MEWHVGRRQMLLDAVFEHVADEFAYRVTMGCERPTEKPLIEESLIRDTVCGNLPQ